MANAPKLEQVADGFRVRLRVGEGQRLRVTIPLVDERAADRHADQLLELARALVKAGKASQARTALTEAAGLPTKTVAGIVAKLMASIPEPKREKKQVPTFRAFGESWTNGELHKLYPDQVPLKTTAVDDASRLDRYAYPIIGHKPINAVVLDDCEEIMRRIPESASRSRRHIAGTISRVFRMAVYPCRYIQASPLPQGFFPPANSERFADDEQESACSS